MTVLLSEFSIGWSHFRISFTDVPCVALNHGVQSVKTVPQERKEEVLKNFRVSLMYRLNSLNHWSKNKLLYICHSSIRVKNSLCSCFLSICRFYAKTSRSLSANSCRQVQSL